SFRRRRRRRRRFNTSIYGRREIVSKSSPLDSLPEDYVFFYIISFTSPRDACVAFTVSKSFESAVKSDIIWEKFLPAEFESLVRPLRVFSSKKELNFDLCNDPVLIDGGKKSIWLGKRSGKRCIMLSAMNLSSIQGDTPPHFFKWFPSPEDRFEWIVFIKWNRALLPSYYN
ncbi:LOW QUALITY PROTEIN: F-box protein PP2-B10, partial [Capsella rubella]|uniref:LOW QUALITY PROTEIN: F-box protein PP2-B10 n=1 Tax=Capsella rubella TaxID=81985 RepID=UPI000CD4E2F1